MVFALRLDNRMRQIERHTGACYLCRMYAISANARRCINQRNHITAALHQLEADDQADIARAEHQDFLARLDAMQIHHGLCGACADDARQCPAVEGDHIFRSAGCDDNRICFVMNDLLADAHDDLFILIQSDDRRIQDNPYTSLLCFLQQFLANAIAPDLCVMLLGAKELVNLLEQLSARLCVLVEHDDIRAALCRFNCRRQTRRACTYND